MCFLRGGCVVTRSALHFSTRTRVSAARPGTGDERSKEACIGRRESEPRLQLCQEENVLRVTSLHDMAPLKSSSNTTPSRSGQKNRYTKTIHQHHFAPQLRQNAANLNGLKCILMPCHGSFGFNTVFQDLGHLVHPTVDRVLFDCSPALLCKVLYNAVLLTRPLSNVLLR
jgi:hypothetical protein